MDPTTALHSLYHIYFYTEKVNLFIEVLANIQYKDLFIYLINIKKYCHSGPIGSGLIILRSVRDRVPFFFHIGSIQVLLSSGPFGSWANFLDP